MDGNLAMNSHFENISENDFNDALDFHLTAVGNRIISEFLGWEFKKNGDEGFFEAFLNGEKQLEGFATNLPKILNKMAYHESWDKLMPVVEKISDTPMEGFINEATEDGGYAYPITFGMRTELGQWMVRFRGHVLHVGDTLIGAAWDAVVDFIKSHKS